MTHKIGSGRAVGCNAVWVATGSTEAKKRFRPLALLRGPLECSQPLLMLHLQPGVAHQRYGQETSERLGNVETCTAGRQWFHHMLINGSEPQRHPRPC